MECYRSEKNISLIKKRKDDDNGKILSIKLAIEVEKKNKRVKLAK